MVIYEMHVGTFSNTFTGAVQKLDYLKNLGINAVEGPQSLRIPCSPTTLRQTTIGATIPAQLFALKSKYGTPQEFKEFKQCHQRQIAVIVDVVYNHAQQSAERIRRFYHIGDSRRESFCMAVIAPIRLWSAPGLRPAPSPSVHQR